MSHSLINWGSLIQAPQDSRTEWLLFKMFDRVDKLLCARSTDGIVSLQKKHVPRIHEHHPPSRSQRAGANGSAVRARIVQRLLCQQVGWMLRLRGSLKVESCESHQPSWAQPLGYSDDEARKRETVQFATVLYICVLLDYNI
jgi:hypothetical protein